jgi:hypothetical protein
LNYNCRGYGTTVGICVTDTGGLRDSKVA